MDTAQRDNLVLAGAYVGAGAGALWYALVFHMSVTLRPIGAAGEILIGVFLAALLWKLRWGAFGWWLLPWAILAVTLSMRGPLADASRVLGTGVLLTAALFAVFPDAASLPGRMLKAIALGSGLFNLVALNLVLLSGFGAPGLAGKVLHYEWITLLILQLAIAFFSARLAEEENDETGFWRRARWPALGLSAATLFALYWPATSYIASRAMPRRELRPVLQVSMRDWFEEFKPRPEGTGAKEPVLERRGTLNSAIAAGESVTAAFLMNPYDPSTSTGILVAWEKKSGQPRWKTKLSCSGEFPRLRNMSSPFPAPTAYATLLRVPGLFLLRYPCVGEMWDRETLAAISEADGHLQWVLMGEPADWPAPVEKLADPKAVRYVRAVFREGFEILGVDDRVGLLFRYHPNRFPIQDFGSPVGIDYRKAVLDAVDLRTGAVVESVESPYFLGREMGGLARVPDQNIWYGIGVTPTDQEAHFFKIDFVPRSGFRVTRVPEGDGLAASVQARHHPPVLPEKLLLDNSSVMWTHARADLFMLDAWVHVSNLDLDGAQAGKLTEFVEAYRLPGLQPVWSRSFSPVRMYQMPTSETIGEMATGGGAHARMNASNGAEFDLRPVGDPRLEAHNYEPVAGLLREDWVSIHCPNPCNYEYWVERLNPGRKGSLFRAKLAVDWAPEYGPSIPLLYDDGTLTALNTYDWQLEIFQLPK